VLLHIRLFAHAGHETQLHTYEDQVLALLPQVGARVVERLRPEPNADRLTEVQLLEFPSESDLERFMALPERGALSSLRDEAISRTEVLRVERTI
jgi:uncharacterized protein (DUF1330 family)